MKPPGGTNDARFTLSDDGRTTDVTVTRTNDGIRLSSAAVQAALGVPAPGGSADGVDLRDLARGLGRSLAVDADENVAWLGAGAEARSRALRDLTAPDFSLRDLDGRVHRLSDHRGKKVLLVVWASW